MCAWIFQISYIVWLGKNKERNPLTLLKDQSEPLRNGSNSGVHNNLSFYETSRCEGRMALHLKA